MRLVFWGIVFLLSWSLSHAQEQFPTDNLTILTRHGQSIPFTVEIADTPLLRYQGLQDRSSLVIQHGMLFIFETPQLVEMWMKNTPVSLDILFIQEDGRISHIISHTVPYSLKRLSSEGKVKAVLEVQAGTVEKLGIQLGDTVLYACFTPQEAGK